MTFIYIHDPGIISNSSINFSNEPLCLRMHLFWQGDLRVTRHCFWLFHVGNSNVCVERKTHHSQVPVKRKNSSSTYRQDSMGNWSKEWFTAHWRNLGQFSKSPTQDRHSLHAKDTAWGDLLFCLLCSTPLAQVAENLDSVSLSLRSWLTSYPQVGKVPSWACQGSAPAWLSLCLLCRFCLISSSRIYMHTGHD